MICSPIIKNLTGILHILSIFVAILGGVFQIHSITTGTRYSIALPITLTIMMFISIPSQVCLAMKDKHAWITVIGTIVGGIIYANLAIQTHIKEGEELEEEKKKKSS